MNALAGRWAQSEGRTSLAVAVRMWRFWLTNLYKGMRTIITHSEHEEERSESFQHSLYLSIYDTVSLLSLIARSNGRLLLWT